MLTKSSPVAANRLRVLRAERHLSQMQVARELGIGLNRYWKIENGYTVAEPAEREALALLFATTESAIFPHEAVA